MSSRSGYSVPRFENSGQNYPYYNQPSGSSHSRYRSSGDMPKLLAASYYDHESPEQPTDSANLLNKKAKKKKKHKKNKLTRDDLIFLNDEELSLAAEARSKEKKKSKRKKHKDPIHTQQISPASLSHPRDHPHTASPAHRPLRDGYSPPRKKPRTPRDMVMDHDERNRHSGSRSPYISAGSRSPGYMREQQRKKIDNIPSAYADRPRTPPRGRNRSGSRSPNTIKLNQKREKIRKKLAALNREEEKIEEERKAKEMVAHTEMLAAEETRKRQEEEHRELERRNNALVAAAPTNGTHKSDLPVPPPPAKIPPKEATKVPTPKKQEPMIPGFGDKGITTESSPNIDAILRSNRENSPENPNYKIDEDEGIKQFKILDKIGEGTYGQVYKARHNSSGDIVALKKVRCDTAKEDGKNKEGFPITAVREIKILKQLQHKNIISLKAIVTERLSPEDYRRADASFYLVFEYMDHDLLGLLDSGLVKFGEREIKVCMRQLFEGLAYCHSKNFLHRDIKCANILLNNKGEVKLADLGLARYWRKDDPQRLYTNKVITRWYRPPELLLGEEHYGPAVDIWSCGCILGEMFAKRALFRARSEQEQLEVICRVCGTPTPDNWPNVVNLSLYTSLIEHSKKRYPRVVRKEYCYFPEEALDLVDKILTLDPEQRLSADQCLDHPFLSDVDLAKAEPMSLPSQDCHEMWSKLHKRKEKTRRAQQEQRVQQQSVTQNKAP